MGMTAADRAKRDAEIQALTAEQHKDDCRHDDRTIIVTEDATVGNEERLRGIPAIGRVSGTIKGTRPGDSAKALEEAGRDIVRATLDRNRYRPKEQT